MADDDVKKLLSHGSEIAGAAVGGAVGFYVAGPVGAAQAGMLGAATGKLLQELSGRLLSRREKVRVGATAAFAISEIRKRMERGEQPRGDGFFQAEGDKPSPAEEVFEGALLAAKNDHEELKARYYGKLFANVSFDTACSREEANYLLNVMDRLTYLQLVLLRIWSEPERFGLRAERYRPGERITYELLAALRSFAVRLAAHERSRQVTRDDCDRNERNSSCTHSSQRDRHSALSDGGTVRHRRSRT